MAAPAPSYDKLKYGTKTPDALQFDAPVVESKNHDGEIVIYSPDYDFETDWVINSAQPQNGVWVDGHTLHIHHFVPNTWIIKSAYSETTTKEDFLARFYGQNWTLSKLTEHNSYLSYVTSYGSYKPIGVVLSPINASNALLTTAGGLDWPINQGCLKDVVGWSNYGFTSDGTKALYKCSDYYLNNGGTPDSLYNESYPQMALAIFTSNETAQDGSIEIIDVKALVNPTNIEGYRAYCGDVRVYNKDMTFQNVLMRHGCAFKETGNFTETVDGKTVAILNNYGSEQNTAFVISDRGYRSTYNHIRFPAIEDLGNLIAESFPFKFWARLERDSEFSHIWDALIPAFQYNDITDGVFARHLFANASGEIDDLYLNFNLGLDSEGYDTKTIDMMGIFDCSNLVKNIHFNITTGNILSLVNAFKQTHTLESITFNKAVNVSDWQGAFEGSKLVNFPANLYATNRWHNNTSLSEPDCAISDMADSSSLRWFGNWKNGQSQQSGIIYSATLTPAVVGANAVVGSVAIDNSVASTDEMTIAARFCPSVSVPDFDSQYYNIRRLNTADAGDNLVLLVQGIGYDSSNNKIAATPTHIIGGGSTLSMFNVNTLFSAVSYTPDSLNTDYVAAENSSSMFSDDLTSRYYHLTSFNDNWERRYLELSLTATGLKRMDIKVMLVNVVMSTTGTSYTISSTSTPHLYSSGVSHDITAWGIDGTASARVTQHAINVNPYCKNAFYNSAIAQVREILDMKFVAPTSGMISDGTSFSVFGNGNLTSAYIANLNKGDWSLDGTARNSACGGNLANLDEDSANYLLENVFDLTRNTSEAYRIENDLNSFSSWATTGNGWKRPVAFYANGNATIYKEVGVSGDLVLQVALVDCTAVVKRSTVVVATLTNGRNVVSSIPSGSSVTIQVTATGDHPNASIELADHFLYELTENLTSANLYLPAEWGTRSIIHSASVQEANRRGWTVYVGGTVYTV